MGLQIVDAVLVVDGAVLLNLVHSAQTVLNDEQRLAVAVVEVYHGDPQSDGIDLPSPIGGGNVGVLHGGDGVAGRLLQVGGVRRHAGGVVVGEGDEIYGVSLHDLVVAGLLHDVDALVAESGQKIGRVLAEYLGIAVAVGAPHGLLHGQHILGLAGVGIVGQLGQHAAHLGSGDHLMADLGGQGGGYELMVHGLENHFLKVLSREAVLDQSAGGVGMADHGVHLVEGQPVFHLVLIAFADGLHKAHEHIDGLPVVPAVVL